MDNGGSIKNRGLGRHLSWRIRLNGNVTSEVLNSNLNFLNKPIITYTIQTQACQDFLILLNIS